MKVKDTRARLASRVSCDVIAPLRMISSLLPNSHDIVAPYRRRRDQPHTRFTGLLGIRGYVQIAMTQYIERRFLWVANSLDDCLVDDWIDEGKSEMSVKMHHQLWRNKIYNAQLVLYENYKGALRRKGE